ncbi:MAG TPA: glycosyltransferase family 4 protein [Micromonosporaceae bacterium]|nr:glycosyltransferase family 4 protein [Micromonosporaceae bacterium]
MDGRHVSAVRDGDAPRTASAAGQAATGASGPTAQSGSAAQSGPVGVPTGPVVSPTERAAPSGDRTPTRVALVLASSTGGIGRHVRSLTSGLAERGMTVAVYAPEETGRLFAFESLGATFTAVEIPATPQPGDLRSVRDLRQALSSDGVDVVHAHGLRAGLVGGWARPDRVPLVVTWHNAVLAGGLRGHAYRLLERRVARMADVTLGASRDLVDRAITVGGRDVRLGAVAAPTLAPARRSRAEVRAELGLDDDTPLILSVGRLHPQKGYETLVEAAARWRDRRPEPRVMIAGQGPSFLALTAEVSRLDAPVTLLGHRDDVADLLGAADLAIVSSVWEARQLFAQEALWAGVPLVSTAVGGLPELLGDGAVLVPAADVAALDAAVRELLDDSGRRRLLADAGRTQAMTWPTDNDTVRQVVEVYTELLGGAP